MSAHEIIPLETVAQRELRQDDELRDAAHEDAIEVLERMLAMARERKIAGIAVSVVFDDAAYGNAISEVSTNYAGIIGAVTTTQHELVRRRRPVEDI